MKCPFCGHLGDKVVDSRESKEGEVIRRRRECLDCGRRFTSYERIDEIPYMVVKKDGSRERFERQKLIAGLLKACEKRPVSVAALEAVADRVESALQERPEKEMTHRRDRGFRDERAAAARQGRICAVRFGVSALPGHRRVHDRAEGPAQREGMMMLTGCFPVDWSLIWSWPCMAAAVAATADDPGHAAGARRPGLRVVQARATASPKKSRDSHPQRPDDHVQSTTSSCGAAPPSGSIGRSRRRR